ncbi:MAG: hypothetical protein WB586_26695 [Chthoniobacterales bacterium]
MNAIVPEYRSDMQDAALTGRVTDPREFRGRRRPRQALFVQPLVLISAAAVFCACQGRGPDPAAAVSHAVSSATGDDLRVAVQDNVPLYRSGPQQLTRPDARLSKDTLVRVVRKQFGYSLVENPDGDRLGWVANDALGVPPPELLAPRATPVDTGPPPPLGSASPPVGTPPPPLGSASPPIQDENTSGNPAISSPSPSPAAPR